MPVFVLPSLAEPFIASAVQHLSPPRLACHSTPSLAVPGRAWTSTAAPAMPSHDVQRCSGPGRAMPRLGCHAVPVPARPRLDQPRLPCLASPSSARPGPARPRRAPRRLASPAPPGRAASCRSRTCRTPPCLACRAKLSRAVQRYPSRASPRLFYGAFQTAANDLSRSSTAVHTLENSTSCRYSSRMQSSLRKHRSTKVRRVSSSAIASAIGTYRRSA